MQSQQSSCTCICYLAHFPLHHVPSKKFTDFSSYPVPWPQLKENERNDSHHYLTYPLKVKFIAYSTTPQLHESSTSSLACSIHHFPGHKLKFMLKMSPKLFPWQTAMQIAMSIFLVLLAEIKY